MSPSAELDALVAQKVMGVEPAIIYIATRDGGKSAAVNTSNDGPFYCKADVEHWIFETGQEFGYELGEWKNYPRYSTDIAAAWQVVEKLAAYRPSKFTIEKCGAWLVRFDDGLFTPGETASIAICLAALKSVGYCFKHDDMDTRAD